MLMRFDTRDLELKRIEAFNHARGAETRYRRFQAEKDNSGRDQTAEALQAQYEMQAADAETALYQSQIEKATVVAPIGGRVMTGDLRDKVMSTMKQGEPLFEIAEPDKLRVEISLNERDSQRVRDDASRSGPSRGEVRTSSRPDRAEPITIERIVPSDTPREGQNTFTVYAKIDQAKVDPAVAATWLPGQAGEASIEEQPRTLMYQWTHRLVDWARLKVWIF